MVANLFDPNFYRLANPDLAAAGITTDAQLKTHFLNFGANEGRAFSPFINLGYYRSSNPDLGLAGLTTNRQAFDHLEQFGLAEGRRFSIVFSADFYRSRNRDLLDAIAFGSLKSRWLKATGILRYNFDRQNAIAFLSLKNYRVNKFQFFFIKTRLQRDCRLAF